MHTHYSHSDSLFSFPLLILLDALLIQTSKVIPSTFPLKQPFMSNYCLSSYGGEHISRERHCSVVDNCSTHINHICLNDKLAKFSELKWFHSFEPFQAFMEWNCGWRGSWEETQSAINNKAIGNNNKMPFEFNLFIIHWQVFIHAIKSLGVGKVVGGWHTIYDSISKIFYCLLTSGNGWDFWEVLLPWQTKILRLTFCGT